MRGRIDGQAPLFHTFSVEDRIRPDHPLRDVKRRADRILDALSPKFTAAYAKTGRPSVPPERLLKAQLLLALYSVRSERQLCERIDTDLLFRWFLDLQPGDDAFDPAVFSHDRERLGDAELTRAFFDAVVAEALTARLCSDHFSVDGTLIESFASAKSFQPIPATPTGNPPGGKGPSAGDGGPSAGDGRGFKPSNPEVDFRGGKRANGTHRSRTDPEAKLYRKGPRQGGEAVAHGPRPEREPQRLDRGGPGDRGERHGGAGGGVGNGGRLEIEAREDAEDGGSGQGVRQRRVLLGAGGAFGRAARAAGESAARPGGCG